MIFESIQTFLTPQFILLNQLILVENRLPCRYFPSEQHSYDRNKCQSKHWFYPTLIREFGMDSSYFRCKSFIFYLFWHTRFKWYIRIRLILGLLKLFVHVNISTWHENRFYRRLWTLTRREVVQMADIGCCFLPPIITVWM